jgi:hypothetical protein
LACKIRGAGPATLKPDTTNEAAGQVLTRTASVSGGFDLTDDDDNEHLPRRGRIYV